MQQSDVLAVRHKGWFISLLPFGVLVVVFCFVIEMHLALRCVFILFGAIFLAIGLYFAFIPKTAITVSGEQLVLHLLFRKKTVPLSEFKYVSYRELGTFEKRNGFISNIYFLKNDIRTLFVTYRRNGTDKCIYVLMCMDAVAAAAAITALAEKSKARTE